ncbi:MAG: DUF1573 domain-containing protein [Chitinophagaceae bacterium]
MKKAIISGVLIIVIASCKNNDQKATISQSSATELALKDSANFTTMQWLDSMHRNLGKITEGEQLEVSFRFKNTGNKPLIIANVRASCGCTIPETPKEPFAPGAEGTIKAKFNSSHRTGPNKKEIYVTANTSPSTMQQLEFAVEVEKKAE